MPQYDLYSDGSVKDKVGYFGFVLFLDHKEIDRGWGEAGLGVSSLSAEYHGLSAGLDSFIRHIDRSNSELNCYSDCAPLVRNLNKISQRDTSPQLSFLLWKIEQARKYSKVGVLWVPRYKNVIADALAKTLRQRHYPVL